VSQAVAELTAALERVAAAMDAEVDAVRLGQADALSAAVERKRAAVEAAEPTLRRFRDAISAATPAERACLIQATRRMQAAVARNAATLQGALDGARRLYACLAEAAQAAASAGTYRPDGSRHRAEESFGTIHRRA
jgi:ATP/maltotriose-dependent transcriptional regulator MalT